MEVPLEKGVGLFILRSSKIIEYFQVFKRGFPSLVVGYSLAMFVY